MQAAEESKNAILAKLLISTSELETDIVNIITNTSVRLSIIIGVVLLLLVSISLIAFIYLGLISPQKAAIAFAVAFIYIIVMFTVFIQFTGFYSRKRLNNANKIFNNFIASEDVLRIVNGAAVVYNTNNVI